MTLYTKLVLKNKIMGKELLKHLVFLIKKIGFQGQSIMAIKLEIVLRIPDLYKIHNN